MGSSRMARVFWQAFLAQRSVLLIVLGLLWGVASLLYGLAIDLLGIALGFAIQLGLSIVAGSLVPFALIRGFSARTLSDAAFLAGVGLMVVGVVICARAGRSN